MSRYTDLITSEHADKPLFVATVDLSSEPFVNEQSSLLSMPGLYDITTAAGVQLDAVGLWVGQSRFIITPLTGVYFSFDTEGLGLDQGYWQGPYDPTHGSTSLPDSGYRSLLRAVISLNHWDGGIAGAKAAMDPLFPDNQVYVQDRQDMSILVAVGGPPLDPLLGALLTGGYLALKPMGVRINYVFTSLTPYPVFGFDANNSYIGGLDTGTWGQSTPITS